MHTPLTFYIILSLSILEQGAYERTEVLVIDTVAYKGADQEQGEESVNLRQKADRCRAEEDSNAFLGTRERELGHRDRVEAKQREAIRLERECGC